MSAMKTYAATEIALYVGGISIDSGRADGDFLQIAQGEDRWKVKVGADGELVRSLIMNTYAVLTVTLLQTSIGNRILSGIHIIDVSTKGGGAVPVAAKDNLGLDIFASIAGWIVKMPDSTYGMEAGTTQWMIGCHEPKRFVGGHSG